MYACINGVAFVAVCHVTSCACYWCNCLTCPFAVSFVSSFEKLVCCAECAQHFMFPSIESAVLYAVSAERQVRITSLVVFQCSQCIILCTERHFHSLPLNQCMHVYIVMQPKHWRTCALPSMLCVYL